MNMNEGCREKGIRGSMTRKCEEKGNRNAFVLRYPKVNQLKTLFST